MLTRKCLTAAMAFLLASCGGDDGGSPNPSPPPPPPAGSGVQIAISPAMVSLDSDRTQQFQCTVTGSSNTSCTWSVREGAAGGTVSTSGYYNPPTPTENGGTYHVVATSAADPTRTAVATVNVGPRPAISILLDGQPLQQWLYVAPSATRQLGCRLVGVTGATCNLSVAPGNGTLSPTGLYTAPAQPGQYTIVGTASHDPSFRAETTVIVEEEQTPRTLVITPGAVTMAPGTTQQFACSITGGPNLTCSLSVAAGQGAITPEGLYTAPSAPGTYAVVATASDDPNWRTTATVTVAADPPPTEWVTGYYAGYFWEVMYPPEEVDMRAMTHLVFARTAPGGGTLGGTPGAVVEAAGTAHDANHPFAPDHRPVENYLIDRAHAAGAKALLMLGGDEGDGIGFNLSTADNVRAEFVKNIVDYLVEHDYDGVDVDWENRLMDGCRAHDCGVEIPGTESVRRLIALIQEIRTEANGRAHYRDNPIIITFPGYTVKLGVPVDDYQVTVANLVDQYNLMSYGVGSTWAGGGWDSWFASPIFGAYGAAPVDLDSSIRAYEAAGVINAREKIGVGIGFYGTAYGLGLAGGARTPRANADAVQYYNLGEQGFEYNFMKELGYIDNGQMVFDDQARAIYRTYPAAQYPNGYIPSQAPHNGRPGVAYVTYENGRSIYAKGEWAREGGAAGTIIWMINYGYVSERPDGKQGTNTLLADVKCAFLQRGCGAGPITP